MKFIKEHWLFALILVVCATLRLMPLFDYQLTLDELSGLNRTRFDSFGELIERGVKIDAHPLLIQVLLFMIVKTFGYVTWIVKLPFLLMGLGAIVYAYIICIKNFSKQAGIFAAVILSFSLIFVFYAPIARMYIAGVFFSTALLFYFFEIFFKRNNKIQNYIFLGLFALLSALNHHINTLFALSLCLSGLLFLNKANRKPYIITCLLALLCYLPNISVTLYQLSIGGIGFEQHGWLPIPDWTEIFRFIKILLGTGETYLIVLILLATSVIVKRRIVFNKKQIFLLGIFLINYLIVWLYSVFRAPVYQNSVMLFASVAFVIFISSLIEFKNKSIFFVAAISLASVLLYKTYLKKDYFNQSVKTVFEYQFERTFHYKKLYGDKNVYPVFFDADEFMEQIYFRKYGPAFECKISSDSLAESMKRFSTLVSNLKSDYLILSSSFPSQQALASEYFPYLIENTQTQGINFKVYSRNPLDKKNSISDDRILVQSDVNNRGDFTYDKLKGSDKKNNFFKFKVDSLNEFPFDAKAIYSDVVSAEGQVMLVKSTFKLSKPPSENIITCISVNDATTNENFIYNSKNVSDFRINPDSTAAVFVDLFFGTTHPKIKDRSKITAYIWNRNKEKFILRNFGVTVIDFCPRKWQLWD